ARWRIRLVVDGVVERERRRSRGAGAGGEGGEAGGVVGGGRGSGMGGGGGREGEGAVAGRPARQREGTLGPLFRYAALVTRFDLRQRVQTRMRRVVPFTTARTRWRFGYQRRLVLLFAWLTLCPDMGPLPQISQTRAMDVR